MLSLSISNSDKDAKKLGQYRLSADIRDFLYLPVTVSIDLIMNAHFLHF